MSNLDLTLLDAVSAQGAGNPLDAQEGAVAILQVSGIFVGTVTFQATLDGSNWHSILAVKLSDGSTSATTTGTGLFAIPASGLEGIRPNVTAYTSGRITVVGRVSEHPSPSAVTASGGATSSTITDITGIASIAGQKTKAASFPVVLPSDQDVLVVDATGQGDVPVTLDSETVELGAGTASIGTLGANSGVDIGDVDVTSVPGALQGPGNPTVDSYSSAAVDLAASANNQELVAAPGAGKQIWVYGLFVMADTAAGTVTLQDEDDTALSGTMAVSDEGGWVLPMSGNFAMPWIKVATNKAIEADTGACTVHGIITYAIVGVS